MIQNQTFLNSNSSFTSKMEVQIRELFENYNIEVASDTGNEFNIFCPFHKNLHSPAFFINRKTGLWQCFNPSCAKKGNFRQLYRQITGKSYSKNTSIDPVALSKEIERGFRGKVISNDIDIDSVAIDYDNSDEVNLLSKFLDRGLTVETMNHFEIGFSRLKERIVIPVRDPNYKLVGFIGRATSDEQEPRYLYNKGFKRADVLFNIQNAKRYPSCIITEGSVDAMMVHQAGYPNVVATLGAQVSANQIKMLKRYFDELIIFSDNDDAGNAMKGDIINLCRGKVLSEAKVSEGCKDPGEMKKEQITHTIENKTSII